ncbi:MAG: hypothetical protein LBB09_01285 [Rickettsiales bacterium]|jgi:hypothetical protein|nr:hypothetical protein [Rickettsiales bacterium]
MEVLKQLKGSIAFLTRAIGTDENIDKQNATRGNLERMLKDPQWRPILERAFNDSEKEYKGFKFASKKASDFVWGNFYSIRSVYLDK